MGHTEEHSDFQRSTVIGCHLSNKSVRQISALLELPRSTVNAVILLLAYGSLAAGLAIISWKRDCVADAVPLYQYTLVLISPTSEG